MIDNFPEQHKIINVGSSGFVAASEDIFNGSPQTDVVSLKNWKTITFVIQKNAGTAGTGTITVLSCDDATPTTTTAIAFRYRYSVGATDTFTAWTAATTAGFTTTAGADQVYEITVNADELATSSTTYLKDSFVCMKVTEVDSTACDGAIFAILSGPRYGQSLNGPSVLS